MVAPVNIRLGFGAFTGASTSGAQGHGIGAQSGVLQILCIMVENNSASSVPTVSSCASDNGLVWQKYASIQSTALSADTPGPTNNTLQRIEVWYAYGAVTNGGTYSFTLSGTADAAGWEYLAFTGAYASAPFDPNISLPGLVSNQASSDCAITVSTSTADIQLLQVFGRSADALAGDPFYSTTNTNGDGGISTAEFSSINHMRSSARFKAYSGAPASGVKCGYAASLTNGPVTNFAGIVFAITADPPPPPPPVICRPLVIF